MSLSLLLKHTLKRTAGNAAVAASLVGLQPSGPRACILSYHRVAAVPWLSGSIDNWNVIPERFERQIAGLALSCRCVPLSQLRAQLAAWREGSPPIVSVTFDDGFFNIARYALPVLSRYGIPATMFVVTSYIGQREPMPFDRWGLSHHGRVPSEAWRAMDWSDVDRCVATGLITIGSHSHRHQNGRGLSAEEFRQEAECSRDVLKSRLGPEHASAYAYPYGSVRLGHVPLMYVAAVRDAGYGYAVSTDLGLVTPRSQDYLLPRVEAHGLDSPTVLHAKAKGALLPYLVTDRLRRAHRGA